MKRQSFSLILPALLCLALLAALPAYAESDAATRLRVLAEQSAANQNASSEEITATRSLTSLLSGAAANSEATGKAALALSEIALGKGNADQAKNLAEAVLDMVSSNDTGLWGALAGRAKALLSAATSVQQAYAAGAPEAEGQLPFVDADLFDRKLSKSLSARPATVEVTFPTPVNMRKIPDRLDKWFSAVEKSGGKIDTVAVPEYGRSVLGLLFDLAVKIYAALTQVSLYDAAKHYNATVYYKSPSGTLLKVIFTLRPKS